MGWKMFDYRCECGHNFESTVWVSSLPEEGEETADVLCPKVVTEALQGLPEVLCGAVASLMPSGNLGFTNDKEKTNAMLKKRSEDHTRKEQKSGNMLSPRDLPKL